MLSKEQIALRKSRVGASEIGALIDYYAPREDGQAVDPYKTAFDVFAERDCPRKDDPADHQVWGLDMEGAILTNWTRRQEGTLVHPVPTFTHPKINAICATPDGFLVKGERMRDLQAKNAQFHQMRKWGDAGTDDVPLLYVAQVTLELGILLAQEGTVAEVEREADVVVSLGGAPPMGFPVRLDTELFGQLSTLASKFKRDHLDPGKAPEITLVAADSAAEWIKRKYPVQIAPALSPTAELASMVQLVATLRKSGKALEEEKLLAEAQLKALLKEADGIEGLCTYRKNKDSTGPDWEKIAFHIASLVPANERPSVYDLVDDDAFRVVTKEGPRVLRITEKKETKHAA